MEHTPLASFYQATWKLYGLALMLGLYNLLMYHLSFTTGRLHSRLPGFVMYWVAWVLMPGSLFYGIAHSFKDWLRWKPLDAFAIVAATLTTEWLAPLFMRATLKLVGCLRSSGPESEIDPPWTWFSRVG